MLFRKKNKKKKLKVSIKDKTKKDGFLSEEQRKDIGTQVVRFAVLSPNPVPELWRLGKRMDKAGVSAVTVGEKMATVFCGPFRDLYGIIFKKKKFGHEEDHVNPKSPTASQLYFSGQITTQELVDMGVRLIRYNHVMSILLAFYAVAAYCAMRLGMSIWIIRLTPTWETTYGLIGIGLFMLYAMLDKWSAYMKIVTDKNLGIAGFMLHAIKTKEIGLMTPIIPNGERLEKQIKLLVKQKKALSKKEKLATSKNRTKGESND